MKTIRLGLVIAAAFSAQVVNAAQYQLVKSVDNNVNPFAEGTLADYWKNVVTQEAPTGPIGEADDCILDSSSKLFTTSLKNAEFPGRTLYLGNTSYTAGAFYVRYDYSCEDLQWYCGNMYDGTPNTKFSVKGGTVTLHGGSTIGHKMYCSTATPAAGGFCWGISSELICESADTVLTVLLNANATEDCHKKDDPNAPLDAQMFLSGNNTNFNGRIVINTFGHLALGHANAAGAPAELVTDRIEIQANGRLAVQKGIEVNPNCGITVTGEGAKLMAKKYDYGGFDCTEYTLTMPITGACGLTKDGDGKVTLAGAYTAGDLTVAAGTLVLDKRGSFKSGLKVTVKSGATLVQNVYVPQIDVTCEEGGTYIKDIRYEVNYDDATGVSEPLDLQDIPDDAYPLAPYLSEPIAVPFYATKQIDIAKVSATAGPENFIDGTEKTYGLPHTSFSIEERENGVRMLVLTAKPVVVSIGPFTNPGSGGKGIQGDGTTWSNHEEARAGFDYLVATNSIDGFHKKFLGDSVTIANAKFTSGGNLNLRSTVSYVGAATVYPGVQFHPLMGSADLFSFSSDTVFTLVDDGSGKFVTFETVWASGGQRMMRLNLNVPVGGSGPLQLRSTDPKARIIDVTGDNSEFTGVIKVTTSGGTPSLEDRTVCHVGRAESLGGPLAAFDPCALTVEAFAMLQPDQTMTLAAANRGIYVKDGGFIVTSGQTLTIQEPLRIGTTLYKEGEGSLALGGAVTYGADGAAATPSPIKVREGAVSLLADVSSVGYDVEFAAGTGIVVDPASTSVEGFTGDFAAAGKVTVSLATGNAERRGYVLPICTRSSTDDDLTDVLVAAPARGFVTAVEKVTVDGDRVRYQLRADPQGMILMIK